MNLPGLPPRYPTRFRRTIRIWAVPDWNPATHIHRWVWVWHCTLCQPDTFGVCLTWRKAINNSRRHCTRNRPAHHAYIEVTQGKWVDCGHYHGRVMRADLTRPGGQLTP